ncbi:hypothetical protein NQ317_017016 [Molorchus minor]|uniref:Sodium/hydrogen exchanger n=1 Tax=Molorchus minor TaxID=1323400 RepID=A0ABQ9IVI8_9CUCU|nr:hypothetical protein NQ317_017016 [Molorchus minor]
MKSLKEMAIRNFAICTIFCFLLFWNIASFENLQNGNVSDPTENNTNKPTEDNQIGIIHGTHPNSVSTGAPVLTDIKNDEEIVNTAAKDVLNISITVSPHINTNTSNGSNNSIPTQTVDPVPVLPDKEAAEDEHNSSMAIFFVLCALIGLIMNALSNRNISNWRKEEAFSPTAFFLILLPPIIFESGYNLHKGTTISAFVIGFGIYFLGLAGVVYRLGFVESFAFGSLISAVDPVATVAIFHALDVDPILNMLVFGESILNDAIAIVLTNAALESNNPLMSTGEAIVLGIQRFCLMFFASAGIGVVFALVSALLLKHVDLRKNPSLEFAMMLVFTYAPYVLAEGIHLSGIMAILFCGIVMSHYTHFNLSTVTQITMQQTLRTLAFIAETCVFAYLGLALFSFKHRVEPALITWSLILCLLGRACNIFPLAILVNRFREHQITKKMMFIMWFSGLRGAISYALSLHLNFSDETRHVIITTTLIIVLVTTLFFGGSTMPLLKFMQATKNPSRRTRKRKKDREVTLSKTREWGQALDSEHLSETTEGEMEVSFVSDRIKGFVKYDLKYLIPFFTRRFTQQELKDCKSQMTDLTNQWYQAIRISPDQSDEESGNTRRSSISSIVR